MRTTKVITIVKNSVLMIEIALVVFLVFMVYLSLPVKSEKIVYIPAGSVTKSITHLAKSNSDILSIDGYILRLFFGRPQQGWINIKYTTLTKADYLYAITHAKAAVKNITLVPGETTEIFLQIAAKNYKLDVKKLQKMYEKNSDFKEGFLVPQTYGLPVGINVYGFIHYLTAYARDYHTSLSKKFYGNYNTARWEKVITIASIIQKEAANKQEMPLVASVIYNRLKKGMKLQMDGTLNYGQYSHAKVTPNRIRHDTSRFNTYKYKGLPPYPVCVVSGNAIKATLSPAKTSYLYFMRNKKRVHDFTRYYSTHLKNINIVKKSNTKR